MKAYRIRIDRVVYVLDDEDELQALFELISAIQGNPQQFLASVEEAEDFPLTSS